MFYIYSGCYSDFEVHAVTEDEDLARMFCAIHNSKSGGYSDSYNYTEIVKLEDICDIDKNLVDIYYVSEIRVDIKNGNYKFEIEETQICSDTDYRMEYDVESGHDVIFLKTEDDDRNKNVRKCNKSVIRFELRRNTGVVDIEKYVYYIARIYNFRTNNNEPEKILKAVEDYWYSMLDLTDGIVNIDTWNEHELLASDAEYKRFVSAVVDLSSCDWSDESIDSLDINVYRDYISGRDEYGSYPNSLVHFQNKPGGYRDIATPGEENLTGLLFDDNEVPVDGDTDEIHDSIIEGIKNYLRTNKDKLKEKINRCTD